MLQELFHLQLKVCTISNFRTFFLWTLSRLYLLRITLKINEIALSQLSSDCHLLERAHVVRTSSAPDLPFLSVSIVRCYFPSLALTGSYKELEVPQKRLLRYIRQGSHKLLCHKNTICRDRAVHLGRISADIISLLPFSMKLTWTFILVVSIRFYQRHTERMTIQSRQLCKINSHKLPVTLFLCSSIINITIKEHFQNTDTSEHRSVVLSFLYKWGCCHESFFSCCLVVYINVLSVKLCKAAD